MLTSNWMNVIPSSQDRKQFICAQGPTDTTVNDFWRMIWEHGLELIVMLTNLEEYSKVKCSKYWPDEVRGSRAFGGLTVQHVNEKRWAISFTLACFRYCHLFIMLFFELVLMFVFSFMKTLLLNDFIRVQKLPFRPAQPILMKVYLAIEICFFQNDS